MLLQTEKIARCFVLYCGKVVVSGSGIIDGTEIDRPTLQAVRMRVGVGVSVRNPPSDLRQEMGISMGLSP